MQRCLQQRGYKRIHTNYRSFVNPICTIYILCYAVLSDCGRILFSGISSIQPNPLCLAHYNSPQRKSRMEAFLSGQTAVLRATIAAGKDIDKADVWLIVHYDMSGNFVAYSQESGRVGLDGALSRYVLFASSADIVTQRRRRQLAQHQILSKV